MYTNKTLPLPGGRPFRITSELFFSENNQFGYCSKSEFVDLIESPQRDKFRIKDLTTMFQSFSERFYITSVIKVRETPQGSKVAMFKLEKGMNKLEVEVPVFGKLLDFINDYRLGRISPSMTITDLYNISLD